MKIVKSNDECFEDLWQKLFLQNEFQPPLYQFWNAKFYNAFRAGVNCRECSFVIVEKKKPLIGLRLTYDEPTTVTRKFSFFGLPILYVENPNVSLPQIRSAQKAFKIEWKNLLDTYNVDSIYYQDFSIDSRLSFLGRQLIDQGASVFPHLTQIIDLSISEMELHREIRKSYKSLINWGKKNLALRVLNSETVEQEDIERFRLLHFHVSGRETRSRETWEAQCEMIAHNEAFAILGELDDDLVTAALFSYSPKYCYYGVSASKRELFSKPLSHVLMWNAIQYAKNIGCHFFELGPQYYSNHHPEITKKELNIATFKHGFGGRTHVRLNVLADRHRV